MNEPTFDRDGYPTDETLEAIENWPIDDETFLEDLVTVMDFVGRAWNYPEYWEKTEHYTDRDAHFPVTRYVFSTCGWSGNESLVSAMEQHRDLQMLGPWSWRRGGHYEYRLPEPKEKP